MPNKIKFFFNHKLTGADFKNNKAWFTISRDKMSTPGIRDEEIEIEFDFLIGADGAHSSARYHLMKYIRMDYQQEYIDTLWCEFRIKAREVPLGEDPESRFQISPQHLHIWPGKDFMFIAIPSFVRRVPPFSNPANNPRMVPSPAHFSCPHLTSQTSKRAPPPFPSSSTPTSPA
jgi:kynurenine 3-monooxygenase